jgi:hypothetical protein
MEGILFAYFVTFFIGVLIVLSSCALLIYLCKANGDKVPTQLYTALGLVLFNTTIAGASILSGYPGAFVYYLTGLTGIGAILSKEIVGRVAALFMCSWGLYLIFMVL